MKIFTGTSYFSAILIAFLWIIPVTSAYAKSCKPSAELIDSYMEFRKINSGLNNRPDLVSSDVIKANSIKEIQYNSAGTPVEREYENLNWQIRNRSVQVNQAAIAGYDENIAWTKLRIENILCVNNRAPDPTLYQSGNIPQNNSNQASNDSPTTKKLSAAEQRRQEAQQKADDLGTQSQQLAQENQSKADAARQGKRKIHSPDAEAHQCVKPSNAGNYGQIRNVCGYKIEVTACGYSPEKGTTYDSIMKCENQSFGSYTIGAGKVATAHTKGIKKLYYFACKSDAAVADAEFIEGQGIRARCFYWKDYNENQNS